MSKEDYYQTIGVQKNASDADIKKAYRRLAMKYHPDRNTGDSQAEVKFKEIREAYDVLSNPQKRQAYDQFGHAGLEMGGSGAGAHASGFSDIFGDVFGDIFGDQGNRRGRSGRGSDMRLDIELTLEESVRGIEKHVQIPTQVRCESCSGSGAKPGSAPSQCGTCGGRGQVRMQQGFFSIQQTCPHCQGKGKVIKEPCAKCRGQGQVQKKRDLKVNIPAGIDNEDQIRLTGEGEAGAGGSGDLYVRVRLRPHSVFKRDGDNLYCDVPIDFPTLALGGNLDVPTMDGWTTIRIPAETQSGKSFRLRGKGVRNVRNKQVGDLLCKIHVETPVRMNSQQKELLEQFKHSLSSGGSKHTPQASGWTDKLKKIVEGFVG